MKKHARVVAFAVALVMLSCHGTYEQYEPGNLEVTLSLDGDTLEVVETRDIDTPDDVAVDADGLDFTFFPDDGSTTVEGTVPDTRIVRSEFGEDGSPDPLFGLSSFGLFEVQLPAVPGRLELRTPDGELVGSVWVDPDQPVTRRSALVRQQDMVGPPVKLVNHGSTSSKADILFLPDGYTESELGAFRQHVNTAVAQMRQLGGYQEYWQGFNVWRQDVKSSTRGAGSNGQALNTAFETAFGHAGIDRCIFFGTSRGKRAARSIGDQIGADVVVVLVNSSTYGGCAVDNMVVVSRPQTSGPIVAHELGHALFGLRDEYETPRRNGTCSAGPNVARSPTSLPWAGMVNTTQLPTPSNASSSTIGAFEGAGYCARGRYRPTRDCMMRSHGVDMCPVCRREMARTLGFSSSGGGSSPSSPPSSGGSALSAPRGLSPDQTSVSSTDVQLTWDRVTGASRYDVTVQRVAGGSWSTFGSTSGTGTSARVTLRPEGGQYRWKVDACSGSCTSSAWATFSLSGAGSSSTGSSNTTSGGSLPVPTNLRPSDSTATSDQTPTMSWSSVSGATHYRFKMVKRESAGNWPTYVSDQQVASSRVSTTLRTPDNWYGFAVRACDSGGCSAWSEYNRFLYRP